MGNSWFGVFTWIKCRLLGVHTFSSPQYDNSRDVGWNLRQVRCLSCGFPALISEREVDAPRRSPQSK